MAIILIQKQKTIKNRKIQFIIANNEKFLFIKLQFALIFFL